MEGDGLEDNIKIFVGKVGDNGNWILRGLDILVSASNWQAFTIRSRRRCEDDIKMHLRGPREIWGSHGGEGNDVLVSDTVWIHW
jgi:hypothetical protein